MSKRRELAPPRSRRRPYQQRQRKRRFLLYCEGKATERDYFPDLARFLRSRLIELKVATKCGKDPMTLVKLAKDARNEASRRAKREHDDSLRYDEVWCVFDRDDYEHVDEAINQAVELGLGVAFSNPCFELWLLLHFQDQYAALTSKQAGEAVRKHVPNYAKHMDFAKLQGRGEAAVKRARRLDEVSQRNGARHGNPTTGVWYLIARICEDSDVPLSDI